MASPLGQKLKAAREQRGLSLLDVSHATKIPVQRLHFLEQDNYAGFGSMAYARAFLRRYSDFLQINAEDMLNDLPGGVLGGPRDYLYLTENHGPWVALRAERVGRLSSPVAKRTSRRSPVPAGIFIFVLALVGTGIWGKYVAEERLEQEKSAPQSVETQPPAKESEDKALSQAVKIITNTQINTPAKPATQVLKALPLSEQELHALSTKKERSDVLPQ
jgi:cytoskeletal protein RodZ